MTISLIDTANFSARLRARAIDPGERRVLISRLEGSDQARDLTVPPNCGGFGRIRHFRQATSPGWPINPLPIVPAARALGLEPSSAMTAQVFQNAACNWRCWYCYVPYPLLAADPARSAWLTAEDLVTLYAAQGERPLVIDLSGGSPDLVPEWVPWMMGALDATGLSESTYLWSDDNLSTEYLFEWVPAAEIERMQAYCNYGRVCCFKGFDEASFSFNTRAAPDAFARQFDIMGKLLGLGLDVYGYATFTAPVVVDVRDHMAHFMDRLQALHPNLPLRVVPLEIVGFSPVAGRMNEARRAALDNQQTAIEAWCSELEARFDDAARTAPICDVPLEGH
ncbi:MAG TPA: radical SAM protein [Stellaceae bacterium]|nr:radical SAM protein [Stellaceae bacterium]